MSGNISVNLFGHSYQDFHLLLNTSVRKKVHESLAKIATDNLSVGVQLNKTSPTASGWSS